MSFSARFVQAWVDRGWTEAGDRVLVACSGGLDSVVLLHLLRFGGHELGVEVGAAHFDHGMRPGSGHDAEWVRGLTGAWKVPLLQARADRPPRTEAEARELRYDFLHGVARDPEVRWVLTAHHADDQIETLLFRILRGTGTRGLRGIPESREPGILRPLLPFTRAEIESYAHRNRLRSRPDPTNRSRRFARNRIRHELLPHAEEIHPGARAAILRLARNSDRTVRALSALLAPVLDHVTVERTAERVRLDRERLLAHPEALRGELLRAAARSLGVSLDETGTATAVEFIRKGLSGARIELSGGAVLAREFDRLNLARPERVSEPGPAVETDEILVASPDAGRGRLRLAGRELEFAWGDVPRPESGWKVDELALDRIRFPLELRGWRPGDRSRTRGGTKKLSKFFVEHRIPRSERTRIPLLADAGGRVIWIPGRHVAPDARVSPGDRRWPIGVRDAGRP